MLSIKKNDDIKTRTIWIANVMTYYWLSIEKFIELISIHSLSIIIVWNCVNRTLLWLSSFLWLNWWFRSSVVTFIIFYFANHKLLRLRSTHLCVHLCRWVDLLQIFRDHWVQCAKWWTLLRIGLPTQRLQVNKKIKRIKYL